MDPNKGSHHEKEMNERVLGSEMLFLFQAQLLFFL